MWIRDKWKKFWDDYKEACYDKEERRSSVNCPYCGTHYSCNDINNYALETDINNTKAIKCEVCASIFGVERITYYDPTFISWKEAKKIWKNLAFDYEGIDNE